MTPERWRKAIEIFQAAAELPPAQAEALIRAQCADDCEMYSEVMRMVAAGALSGILDHAPLEAFPPTESLGAATGVLTGEMVSGRYRIVRFLGRGGMGEVYEAEDLELKDHVALKTLLPAIAGDGRMIARFKQEIQLSRKVSHPNVCRVFDLARHPAGGSGPPTAVFLTMEYLPGETLGARLQREPRLSKDEAFSILSQTAEGLDAAHRVGIIHRDFKPSNVMLVPFGEGLRAVITDFGLARSCAPSGETTATLSGGLMGTLDYMAPELLGGGAATAASDVYAFGTVAYRMVTGVMPFAGAILRSKDPPTSPCTLNPELDQKWGQAILRALDPDPQRRYAQAGHFINALRGEAQTVSPVARKARRWFPPAAVAMLLLLSGVWAWQPWQVKLPAVKSIAILPFASAGSGANNQAFSEGLVESLIGRLSQVERFDDSFSVVPTFEFRGRTLRNSSDVRQAFGVSLVLTGSLHYTNNGIQTVLTLVDARSSRQLASRTLERPAGQSAGLLDQTFDYVVKTLRLRVSPEALRAIQADGTASAAAFDACQEGIGLIRRPGIPQLEQAIALFRAALQKDSGYALAYAGLGEAYADQYELKKDPNSANQARLNGRRAVELNGGLASVHLALGQVHFRTGRVQDANTEFQRVLEIDPGSYYGRYWLARSLDGLGRTKEAEQSFLEAVRMRPTYWLAHSGLGAFYYQHGQYSKAEPYLRKSLDLAPDNYIGYASLGGVYLAMGLYDAAEAVLRKSIGVKESFYADSNLGAVYLMLQRYDDAGAVLEKAVKLNPNDPRVWRNLGDAYRFGHRGAESNECFRKAIELVERQLSVNPSDGQALANMALYQAKLGEPVKAEATLRRALAGAGVNADVHFKAAIVHTIGGESAAALRELRIAFDTGVSREQVLKEPELAPLRGDSRFVSLVAAGTQVHEGDKK